MQAATGPRQQALGFSISRRALRTVAICLVLTAGLTDLSFADDIRLSPNGHILFDDSIDHEVSIQTVALFDGFTRSTAGKTKYLDETGSEEHSGLLGRAYLDAQYFNMVTPDEFDDFSETIGGYRGTLNLPAPLTEYLPDFLRQDLFIAGRHRDFSGTADPGGFPLSIDADLDQLVLGTTLFARFHTPFRPFIQLGYDYQRASFDASTVLGSSSDVDTKEQFFCAPGFELDITSRLALRFATELDFDEVSSSMMTTELVFWFNRNIFARGGLVNDAEWETYGGMIGGGIAY